MMVLIMYYAEYTKLQRIHEKSNMEKFKEAYYEAVETMINHSNHLPQLLGYIQQHCPSFQIVDGCRVSLDQLALVNGQKFAIERGHNTRKRERSESSEFSQHKIQKTESVNEQSEH
jgi:hypothetical protein